MGNHWIFGNAVRTCAAEIDLRQVVDVKFVYAVNYGVFNSVDQAPHTSTMDRLADKIAENITNSLIMACKHITIFVLQIGSEVLLIACLWFILGMMIGSKRCTHWAGVAGLGAAIIKAVSRSVL